MNESLNCSTPPNSLSPSISMAAPRAAVAEVGGGRVLERDGRSDAETPADKKYMASGGFPLSRWEFAAALGVLLVFTSGLLCIYFTMPASEYEMLRLPRNLADLRLLKHSFHVLTGRSSVWSRDS